MTNLILQFFGADPIVAYLLTGAALFVLAAMLYRAADRLAEWWVERRECRYQAERDRLSRILQASTPVDWPRPAKKLDQPWKHTRRSA